MGWIVLALCRNAPSCAVAAGYGIVLGDDVDVVGWNCRMRR